jgi:hypothetical protein
MGTIFYIIVSSLSVADWLMCAAIGVITLIGLLATRK